MAQKRINEAAPLTAAEKQKRHREKQAEEKQTAADKQTERLREQFKKEIDALSPDQLMKLIDLHDHPPKYPDYVTLKELSAMTGISLYELKKLEAEGVIEPVHPSGLTKKEAADIEQKTGLTAAEFSRLVNFLDTNITLPELSKAANIPLRKLEKMDREIGLYQTA